MSRMAPVNSPRQLWVWGSLVVLLSFVWYKRKRNTLRSDPGGTLKILPHSVESEIKNPEGQLEIGEKAKFSSPVSASKSELDSSSDEADHSEEIRVTAGNVVESVTIHAPVSPVGETAELEVSSCSLSEPSAGDLSKVEATVICEVLPSCEEEKCMKASAQETEASTSTTENKKEKDSKESTSSVASEKAVSTSDKMKDTKEVEVSEAPAQDVKDSSDKVASLEGKLASLALGSSEEQRRGAERDSANHSPVDAMLASPSISSYSDEHSEGSSDSGKGCSDVASPPSRTPVGSGSLAGDADGDTGVESTSGYSVYDFLLPQILVGRLIGRHGGFVHDIKAKTNATIWIRKHPETNKQKICSVEGTPADIESALAFIRQRFPLNKFPNVTLEQITLAPIPTVFPLVPDFCQLYLVEGVNNEVMISSLVSPAHMFVQQPYHPSYQFLQRLNHMMNSVYANVETPNLPDPIEAGNICVAPAVDGWYRAQVVSTNEETQTSEIKFVDYGGYMTVNNSVLRQIRQDFMTLPFQATECYLANIKPSGESGEWCPEAHGIVEELTRGQMLLAQVYDYAADGVPLIYLYSSVNAQVVLINQELVARGMADVDDSAVSSTSAEAASLVVAAKAVAAAAAGETSSNTATETSAASSTTVESEDKTSAVNMSSASEVAAN